MRDPRDDLDDAAEVAPAVDSHGSATSPSGKPALLRDADLLEKMFWTAPEAASVIGVSTRTVWRLMADPESKFPKARRIRGRTLLSRDEVLAFMAKEATR
jgi:excisionase family DNA binding protein